MVLKNMRHGSEKKTGNDSEKISEMVPKKISEMVTKNIRNGFKKISEMVPKKYAPFRSLVGICIFALSGFHFAYNRCTKTKAL